MTFTVQIGSGRPLFELPGNRFDNITREPLRTDPRTAWKPLPATQIKEARKL